MKKPFEDAAKWEDSFTLLGFGPAPSRTMRKFPLFKPLIYGILLWKFILLWEQTDTQDKTFSKVQRGKRNPMMVLSKMDVSAGMWTSLAREEEWMTVRVQIFWLFTR